MDIMEHFKSQPPHTRDGVERLFVMANKNGGNEVFSVPVSEISTFLEGTTFSHFAGLIPRFTKTKGMWKNPLKSNVKS